TSSSSPPPLSPRLFLHCLSLSFDSLETPKKKEETPSSLLETKKSVAADTSISPATTSDTSSIDVEELYEPDPLDQEKTETSRNLHPFPSSRPLMISPPSGRTDTSTTTTTVTVRCPLPEDLKDVLRGLEVIARNPYINEEEVFHLILPLPSPDL
ncbi:hypothetical protein CSUI_007972, partial [Cystoisospora suis]